MSAPIVSLSLWGERELVRSLRRIDPTKRAGLMRGWLLESGFSVQRSAQREQMISGGSALPHPKRLTSRTGTGRRSITLDRSELPRAVNVGTGLGYMALHEEGGVARKVSSRGTAFTARYPARPYLKPALEGERERIRTLFLRRWVQAIRTA